MSFSNVIIGRTGALIPVDTRTIPKVLYLPTVSTNAGRYLSFKDYYGTSSNSSITVSTTGTDLLDDYNSLYTLSNAFGTMSFVADGVRSWRMLTLYNGALTPTGASFLPTQISGLTAWLDGSDSSTITVTGTQVTQWRDKSGSNNTVTPLSGLSNASVQSAYQNGLSVLNFSNNNIYRAPAGSGVYPSDVFVVLALKVVQRNDIIGIGATSSDNFNSLTIGEHTANRWHNGSSFFTRTPNTVSPTNETSTSFLLMEWSIANNNFVIRRNGTQLSQTSSYTYSLTGGSVFQIGFRQTASGSPDVALNVYIAEVLIYNSQLGTTNQQQVEGYLAWKWGIQSSLPAGHPYAGGPP